MTVREIVQQLEMQRLHARQVPVTNNVWIIQQSLRQRSKPKTHFHHYSHSQHHPQSQSNPPYPTLQIRTKRRAKHQNKV